MAKTAERYTGFHVGATRELTSSEADALQAAAAKVSPRPPWTPKKLRATHEFREALIRVYEDGVSSRAIAEVLGWDRSRVAMHIRQARLEGLGTGSRRYIPPAGKKVVQIKREMGDRERDEVMRQYELIPKNRAGSGPRWNTKEARSLVNYIRQLQDDNVPINGIAELIGMTRQGLSLHLAKAARDDLFDGDAPEPRSITPSEATRILKKYNKLEVSYNGARIWSSKEGVALIDDIVALGKKGVPIGTIYKRTSRGKVTKTPEIEGVASVLGVSPSVIGRMVAMRDRLAERAETS